MQYMCRLCKTFLSKKHPGVYSVYEECRCRSACKFNTYIDQFKEEERKEKMFEFWKTLPHGKDSHKFNSK